MTQMVGSSGARCPDGRSVTGAWHGPRRGPRSLRLGRDGTCGLGWLLDCGLVLRHRDAGVGQGLLQVLDGLLRKFPRQSHFVLVERPVFPQVERRAERQQGIDRRVGRWPGDLARDPGLAVVAAIRVSLGAMPFVRATVLLALGGKPQQRPRQPSSDPRSHPVLATHRLHLTLAK